MWAWPNPFLKNQIWTTPFRFLFSQNGVELVQENVIALTGNERSTELKPKDPEQCWMLVMVLLVMDISINATLQKEYVLFAQVMQSAGILLMVSSFIMRSIAKTLKRKPQKDRRALLASSQDRNCKPLGSLETRCLLCWSTACWAVHCAHFWLFLTLPKLISLSTKCFFFSFFLSKDDWVDLW